MNWKQMHRNGPIGWTELCLKSNCDASQTMLGTAMNIFLTPTGPLTAWSLLSLFSLLTPKDHWHTWFFWGTYYSYALKFYENESHVRVS